MKIDFVTLFPEMILGTARHSIIDRAEKQGKVEFNTSNPRDFATDNHRKVDDTPYGGGPGMVMMAPLVKQAVDALNPQNATIILTDPMGDRFTQSTARELTTHRHLIFICGHYEGIDERIRSQIAHRAYTIGDYVLTGGELPSLVITDSIVRLLPGVLGDPDSHKDDSHSDGLLGSPAYTRPLEFQGEKVPDVLLSGDHKKIADWRRQQQIQRTKSHRPDLLVQADLQTDDVDKL